MDSSFALVESCRAFVNERIREYSISYCIQVVSSQSSRHPEHHPEILLLPSVHYVLKHRSPISKVPPSRLYKNKNEIQGKSLSKQIYKLSSTLAKQSSPLSPQQVIQEGSAPEYQSLDPYP